MISTFIYFVIISIPIFTSAYRFVKDIYVPHFDTDVNSWSYDQCDYENIQMWGYEKRGRDLNYDAGGDYIYLCALYGDTGSAKPSDTAVINLKIIYNEDHALSCGEGWSTSVDLNRGAGGDYIYLCEQRTYIKCLTQGSQVVTEISAIGSDSAYYGYNSLESHGYTAFNIDINRNAGGFYMYIGYKTNAWPHASLLHLYEIAGSYRDAGVVSRDGDQLSVVWSNGRPNGFGTYNSSIRAGEVTFPDDRKYTFVFADNGYITWDNGAQWIHQTAYTNGCRPSIGYNMVWDYFEIVGVMLMLLVSVNLFCGFIYCRGNSAKSVKSVAWDVSE